MDSAFPLTVEMAPLWWCSHTKFHCILPETDFNLRIYKLFCFPLFRKGQGRLTHVYFLHKKQSIPSPSCQLCYSCRLLHCQLLTSSKMVLILIMELSHLWPNFHARVVGPQKLLVWKIIFTLAYKELVTLLCAVYISKEQYGLVNQCCRFEASNLETNPALFDS